MADKVYTTVFGDTFDIIAYKVYSDSKAVSKIIEANTEYSGTFIFEAGVKLLIPASEEVIENGNIAPWRR
ncbi:MAG: tail protein X [Cetobacterium sp.]|uniref:tail protein X n=1 Tax=Cetobacterium sp. ZOR0034 TaxID=1339239 RepID=UPI0006473B35|nr:tail protein X [Cetobacterium sp. ZOR0034]